MNFNNNLGPQLFSYEKQQQNKKVWNKLFDKYLTKEEYNKEELNIGNIVQVFGKVRRRKRQGVEDVTIDLSESIVECIKTDPRIDAEQVIKRKRGRPRRNEKLTAQTDLKETSSTRGRPRKNETAQTNLEAISLKRGRPRRNQNLTAQMDLKETSPKRGKLRKDQNLMAQMELKETSPKRGRPRRNQNLTTQIDLKETSLKRGRPSRNQNLTTQTDLKETSPGRERPRSNQNLTAQMDLKETSPKREGPRKDQNLTAQTDSKETSPRRARPKKDTVVVNIPRKRGRPRLNNTTNAELVDYKANSNCKEYFMHTFCKSEFEREYPGLIKNKSNLYRARSCTNRSIKSNEERKSLSKTLNWDLKLDCSEEVESKIIVEHKVTLVDTKTQLVPYIDLSVFNTKFIIEQDLKSNLGYKMFKRHEAGILARENKNNAYSFWHAEVKKEVQKLSKVISMTQLDRYMREALETWISVANQESWLGRTKLEKPKLEE